MSASELRQQLMEKGLEHGDLESDPFRQFEVWYGEASAVKIHEPGAMCLATVDENGQPWQRIVLLKLFDEDGFVFFSNYESNKANQMTTNPLVSLLFPWHALGRQLKITGAVEKVSTAESLKYFTTRPRGSQLGAWASAQSSMISSRSILETMVESMKRKYENKEVPLPPFWGGYRVKPTSFEFWQERSNRLHDRFLYREKTSGRWISRRLAP